MTRRIPELLLIGLLPFVGYLAWSTGRERGQLQVEFDRLTLLTGDLPIVDPSKLYIRAIPTGEPLHFAWRIYLPANYRLSFQDSASVTGSSLSRTESREFIARIRIRESNGLLLAYSKFYMINQFSTLGTTMLTDLIRGRETQIVVAQFGSERVETVAPDTSVELLKLTLPDDLTAKAQKSLDTKTATVKLPDFFKVIIGKPEPVSAVSPSGK